MVLGRFTAVSSQGITGVDGKVDGRVPYMGLDERRAASKLHRLFGACNGVDDCAQYVAPGVLLPIRAILGQFAERGPSAVLIQQKDPIR